jgi:hypothetical protein
LTALSQAEKSVELETKVRSLEDQISTHMSRIIDLEEGDKYMTKLLKRACSEMMWNFHGAPEFVNHRWKILRLFFCCSSLQVFVLTPRLKRCGLKPKWKLLQGFLPVLIVSVQTHDDAWPWSNCRIVLSRLEES